MKTFYKGTNLEENEFLWGKAYQIVSSQHDAQKTLDEKLLVCAPISFWNPEFINSPARFRFDDTASVQIRQFPYNYSHNWAIRDIPPLRMNTN